LPEELPTRVKHAKSGPDEALIGDCEAAIATNTNPRVLKSVQIRKRQRRHPAIGPPSRVEVPRQERLGRTPSRLLKNPVKADRIRRREEAADAGS